MKVTLRATYGILAALDLALRNGVSPTQSRAIARRQAIPARFLEQILNALRKAGLVESHRGAQGGYVLRKKPSEVSLAEIVEALEGPFPSSPKPWGAREPGTDKLHGDVILASVWDRLRQAEFNVLNAVTLKDLAERHREAERERALMYHI